MATKTSNEARERIVNRRMARNMPFYPSFPAPVLDTFGYYLRPTGFRPCDALCYAPISASYDRESKGEQGMVMVTQALGEFNSARNPYRYQPPTQEQCEGLALELNKRKEDEQEKLLEEIIRYEDLAAEGKPEWRLTNAQKARELRAIYDYCDGQTVEAKRLYNFFVQLHAAQVQAAVDPAQQQAMVAQQQAQYWAEQAQKASAE